MENRYSYSHDQESYFGDFETVEEAAAEGLAERDDSDVVWVGRNVPPAPPESYVDADWLIEHIQEQDEYSDEWADSWPGATREQRDELEASLRKEFAAWIERHGLQPRFFRVEDVQRIERQIA